MQPAVPENLKILLMLTVIFSSGYAAMFSGQETAHCFPEHDDISGISYKMYGGTEWALTPFGESAHFRTFRSCFAAPENHYSRYAAAPVNM